MVGWARRKWAVQRHTDKVSDLRERAVLCSARTTINKYGGFLLIYCWLLNLSTDFYFSHRVVIINSGSAMVYIYSTCGIIYYLIISLFGHKLVEYKYKILIIQQAGICDSFSSSLLKCQQKVK